MARPRTNDVLRAARATSWARTLGRIALAALAISLLTPALLGLATVAAPRDGPAPEAVTTDPTAPGPATDDHDAATGQFVTRAGAALSLGGERFKFVGFNLYDAAASSVYSCAPAQRLTDAELSTAMRRVRDSGGTVVRFWAFQTYTRGGTDYSGVDRVITAARAHGLKVFPVIENQWADCSRPGRVPLAAARDGAWFSSGYRSPLAPATLSFREYARRLTTHYRDEPTIFAWSLLNEAETHQRGPTGQSVLVDFATDMAAVVRRADPNHLITLGTQSNGAPGASGDDFTAVYGVPGLDFAEVHDWANRGSDSDPMPGAPSARRLPDPGRCRPADAQIACSFALAQELGKPIVVGEAGIAADDAPSRAVRAQQVGAKMDAALRAGASGYLVWQLNRANTDGYAVVLGARDPLYAVLRHQARRWATDLTGPAW